MQTTDLSSVATFGANDDILINTQSGTGRMTGSVAATFGANYFSRKPGVGGDDLTVKFAAEIASYSDVWAWLQARLANHNVTGISPGDYIPWVSDNGYTVISEVAGVNHYLRYNDSDITAWHVDFVSRDLWPELHVMNKANTNNGRAAEKCPYLITDLKAWLNSERADVPNAASVDPATLAVDYSSSGVYYRLPAALKSAITPKRVLLSERYNASTLATDDTGWAWKDIGKIWIPSEIEVYGFTAWGTPGYSCGAFVQYPLFRDPAKRIKGLGHNGSRYTWWLLSARSGSSGDWANVGTGGNAAYGAATSSWVGAAVGFRISAS